MRMKIRKEKAGADSFGNRWDRDGAVVEVDVEQGIALLAIVDGGFSVAADDVVDEDPVADEDPDGDEAPVTEPDESAPVALVTEPAPPAKATRPARASRGRTGS